jgi:hypothetical protein
MNYFAMGKKMNMTIFKEKEYGLRHEVFNLPPDEWAAKYGATHTLFIPKEAHMFPGRGTRPAILKKTVLYVGIDETEEGGIKWEKWSGKWDGVYEDCCAHVF